MEWLEKLYENPENVNVRFVGVATEEFRYDFGIIYTNMFFGKPLVVCMQTGRSSLLDTNDLLKLETLQDSFRLSSLKEAYEVSQFLEEIIPSSALEVQYE